MRRMMFKMAFFLKSILQKVKYYIIKIKIESKPINLESINMDFKEAKEYLEKRRPFTQIDFQKPIMRTKTPFQYDVSIIVPVYNAEKYLEECLNSLVNQHTFYTYEIICVNDGSTDNSKKILQDFLGKYTNISVINQVNLGASAARNSGMKIMSGKYVFFMDADDYLPDNAIQNLIEAAIISDADIVQGGISKCTDNSKIYYTFDSTNKVSTKLLDWYNYNSMGTAWGKLYKRNLWDKIEFFQGYAFEDAIIWCNIYPMCHKITFIPETTYVFRSSKSSLFKRQNNSEKCIDAIWIIDACIKCINVAEMNNEWYQMILWQLSVGIVTRLELYFKNNDIALKASFIIAQNLVIMLPQYGQSKFEGKNKKIYSKIEESFRDGNYKGWYEYSRLLSLAGGV